MMANLTGLDLSLNKLFTLPLLPSTLTSLNLSNNKFKNIPKCIARCSGLTNLDLSLQHPENSSFDITDLSRLVSLKKLNLTCNKLTKLPEGITNLTNLIVLNMRLNQLSTIPNLSQMTSLTELNLTYNKLTEAPTIPPSLKTIHILDNPLEKNLPENITKLLSDKDNDTIRANIAMSPEIKEASKELMGFIRKSEEKLEESKILSNIIAMAGIDQKQNKNNKE